MFPVKRSISTVEDPTVERNILEDILLLKKSIRAISNGRGLLCHKVWLRFHNLSSLCQYQKMCYIN